MPKSQYRLWSASFPEELLCLSPVYTVSMNPSLGPIMQPLHLTSIVVTLSPCFLSHVYISIPVSDVHGTYQFWILRHTIICISVHSSLFHDWLLAPSSPPSLLGSSPGSESIIAVWIRGCLLSMYTRVYIMGKPQTFPPVPSPIPTSPPDHTSPAQGFPVLYFKYKQILLCRISQTLFI